MDKPPNMVHVHRLALDSTACHCAKGAYVSIVMPVHGCIHAYVCPCSCYDILMSAWVASSQQPVHECHMLHCPIVKHGYNCLVRDIHGQ